MTKEKEKPHEGRWSGKNGRAQKNTQAQTYEM